MLILSSERLVEEPLVETVNFDDLDRRVWAIRSYGDDEATVDGMELALIEFRGRENGGLLWSSQQAEIYETIPRAKTSRYRWNRG